MNLSLSEKINKIEAEQNNVDGVEKKDIIVAPNVKEKEIMLDSLKQIIEKITSSIEELSSGKLKIERNHEKNIILFDFEFYNDPSFPYDMVTYSKKPIDFFTFFENEKKLTFYKTLFDFKVWLIENGNIQVFIADRHDGGGIKSWNEYSIKI